MSFTEIFAFNQQGDAYPYATIPNAWRGGMAVWREMEQRHLPPYIPDYVKSCNWYKPGMPFEEIVKRNGFEPTRATSVGFKGKNPMQEVWDLADDPSIPEYERIALFTTFDDCLVRRENLERVIVAFRQFGGDTNLGEQADILERAVADPNVIAVGWGQTSVCTGNWGNSGGYNEESGEYMPYNCLAGTKHYWLFDKLYIK